MMTLKSALGWKCVGKFPPPIRPPIPSGAPLAQNKKPVTVSVRAKWAAKFQEKPFPLLIVFISFI
jgi:hypothetical protein